MEIIVPSFVLLLVTQIWKFLTDRLGVEKSRLLIHGFLFGMSLIVAGLKYWGIWDSFASSLISLWAMASGEYEILKTIFKSIVGKKG